MYKYFGLNTKEQTIDDNVPGSLKELLENNPELWNQITDIKFEDGTTIHQKNGLFHNHDKPLADSDDKNLFSSYSVQINDMPKDKNSFRVRWSYCESSMSYNNGVLQSPKRNKGYYPSVVMQNEDLKKTIYGMTFMFHDKGKLNSFDNIPAVIKQTYAVEHDSKMNGTYMHDKYTKYLKSAISELIYYKEGKLYREKFPYKYIIIPHPLLRRDIYYGASDADFFGFIEDNLQSFINGKDKPDKIRSRRFDIYPDLSYYISKVYFSDGKNIKYPTMRLINPIPNHQAASEKYIFYNPDQKESTISTTYLYIPKPKEKELSSDLQKYHKQLNYSYTWYYDNDKELHREDGPAYIVKDGDKIIEEKYYNHGEEVEDISKYNKYIDKSSEIIFELSNGLLAKDYIDKYDPKNYKENLTKEITELIKDKEQLLIKNLFGTDNWNEYNLFNQIENMYKFEFAIYKLLISKILKGDRKDIDETIKKICFGNFTRDCINYNRNKKHHYVTTQLQKDLQEFKDILSVDDINELWLEINLLEHQANELREKLNVYTDDCSICIDDTNSDDKILTKCGHWFHRKCINKITNNLCPNCKTRLDEKFENKYNINYGDYNEKNIDNYKNEKEEFKTNCDDIENLRDCIEEDEDEN
jgi:hypothetical protein